MHLAANYLMNKWGTFNKKQIPLLTPLTYLDAANLKEYLEEDGVGIAYSAYVSMADAIRGLEAGFHSWAAVKLYYCLFYTLHAYLAFDGTALFFSNRKPFLVSASAGSRPQAAQTSSSHKAIMDAFSSSYPNSLILSQTINFHNPFVWMQRQREAVNYSNARFSEPDRLNLFQGILQARSVRRAVCSYISDDYLAFDQDHSIMSFPILSLKELKKFKAHIFELEDQERLLGLITDTSGRIAAFDSLVR